MRYSVWLLFDLVYAILFVLVIGPPLTAAAWLGRQLFAQQWFGSLHDVLAWLLVPALALAFLFTMVLWVGVLRRLLPVLQPGSYMFPDTPQARAWALHFSLQRVVHLPLWAPIFFSMSTLRWLLLRGLGARVAFNVMASSDAAVLDASLISIGNGAMLGGGSLITGHYVEHGRLYLAPVVIGAGSELSGSVTVSPGVHIGTATAIGPGTKLLPHVVIGDDTHIGMGCVIYNGVRIGSNVVIGHEARIETNAVIGDGAVIRSAAIVPRGVHIAENSTFPAKEKA